MATWPPAKKSWPRHTASSPEQLRTNPANETASRRGRTGATAALELVRRGIDLVQHLDPAGVGARDLRECLLIQIAAQQQEFSHLYAKRPAEPEEDPHRSLRPRPRRSLKSGGAAWRWRR